MNELFSKRVKQYFGNRAEEYISLIGENPTQGLFLNTKKLSREDIISLLDFDIKESEFDDNSFYHFCSGIGKTKAYELGLIYPQDVEASYTASVADTKDVKLVVDMCAAPGGKTINIINRLSDDALCISNEVNYTRAKILSSNIERMGFDNVIVTNKKCSDLAKTIKGNANLVILDAPCSGEGMIRKYPEILDTYNIDNILELSKIQEELLENAYVMLKNGGQLIYSTCTYAFEEDENQIANFLEKHKDMNLVELHPEYSSTLKGTVKLSPLNNTEGQFVCLMKKNDESGRNNLKHLKPVKEKLVDEFIKKNLKIDDYYLYKDQDSYYLSFYPVIDLGGNMMRYGILAGEIVNKRFEPSHTLYRANRLSGCFKNVYDLIEEEYNDYVKGLEISLREKIEGYTSVVYKGNLLGFGKCSNGKLKNKYPKGLRRV